MEKKTLNKIRKSCEIASKILHEVVGNLVEGKSEKEVASEIRKLAKKKGGLPTVARRAKVGIAFQPIVAFGKHSATPHHRATTRKLKKGDVVKIDLGVKFEGWCSDITRTFFTSKPTMIQKEAYEAVLDAQLLGIRKVKVGMQAKELDKVSRDFLKQKGFAKNFIHSLGHGVGKRIHQSPKISPKCKTKIREGMVITIEPGVYLKGKFGVRIEDTLLVKKRGVEILTKFPKKLRILKL